MRFYSIQTPEFFQWLGGASRDNPFLHDVTDWTHHDQKQLRLERIDEASGRWLKESDFPVLTTSSGLVLSWRALGALDGLIRNHGDIVRLEIEDSPVFLFTPVKLDNAIDTDRSKSDEVFIFDPALRLEAVREVHVFTVSQLTFSGLFASEAFKQRVEANDLRGLEFTRVRVVDDTGAGKRPLGSVQLRRAQRAELAADGSICDGSKQAVALGTWCKVLVGGSSCFEGSLNWSLPSVTPAGAWTPGDWVEVEGPPRLCRHGLHLTADPFHHWPIWDMEVYEAEIGGVLIGDRTKAVTNRARLLRRVPPPEWWTAAVEMIESQLPAVRWFDPDGAPDPAWRLFTGPSWADAINAAEAAMKAASLDRQPFRRFDEAIDAAIVVAEQAWRRIATEVAVGTLRGRVYAAADAVAEVLDADEPESWVLGAVAKDITEIVRWLVAPLAICRDLDLDPRHVACARDHWSAYRKGYIPIAEDDHGLWVVAKCP